MQNLPKIWEKLSILRLTRQPAPQYFEEFRNFINKTFWQLDWLTKKHTHRDCICISSTFQIDYISNWMNILFQRVLKVLERYCYIFIVYVWCLGVTRFFCFLFHSLCYELCKTTVTEFDCSLTLKNLDTNLNLNLNLNLNFY